MDYVSSLSMAMLTLAKRGQQKAGQVWQISFHKSGLKQPTLNVCMKTSWTNFRGSRVNEGFTTQRERSCWKAKSGHPRTFSSFQQWFILSTANMVRDEEIVHSGYWGSGMNMYLQISSSSTPCLIRIHSLVELKKCTHCCKSLQSCRRPYLR